MRKVTLKNRLQYGFDRMMAGGAKVLILWLAIATAVMVLGVSILVLLTHVAPPDWNLGETAWASLLRTLDPGTMGSDSGPWFFRFMMLFVTVGGIFVVGSLIGIITTGMDDKLTELRKGRSIVVEQGHTVILGWSSQVFSIISELVIANENQNGRCIAVLADQGKVEMEDAIHTRIGKHKKTRIVCRRGSPMDLHDLEIVNLDQASSIVIVSPDSPDPDSHVIKTILAITNNPRRSPTPYHIVAAIHDRKNVEVAQLVGGPETQIILGDDLIARITAQTCRQSGLSVVYTELLDFDNDEMYFSREPLLNGKTFGEAMFLYEDSTLVGLRTAEGGVKLNPPMDTVIQPGDQIITISEDDDTTHTSTILDYGIEEDAIRQRQRDGHHPERTLVLGWNPRGPAIIKELDNYVVPGSELSVVADMDVAEMESDCECRETPHQKITFQQGDTTNRRVLDRLEIQNYQHVILLSYPDLGDPQKADARTLVTLLHLRDIADRCGHTFSIVSEMLDMRNRELADVTRADDFIVSDKLVSLMLSQVSENKEINEVFKDLFDPLGSEIYLEPAGNYVALERELNFYTVLESARRRGEIAIGYRLHAEAGDPEKSYGVHLNPDKSKKVRLCKEDRVIVLAEEE